MSRPRSINVVFLSSIFYFQIKQTPLAFLQFLKYLPLFLDGNVDEELKNFQIAKAHPHGVA